MDRNFYQMCAHSPLLFMTHLHSLEYFRNATYCLEVCSLMSDQPGAADVICIAQRIKMRPGKTKLSGLMNPCRGATVRNRFLPHGPNTRRQTRRVLAKGSLCLPFTVFQLRIRHINEIYDRMSYLKKNTYLHRGNSFFPFFVRLSLTQKRLKRIHHHLQALA